MIMAGRFSLVSHLMAEWGVETVKARFQGLIRADLIDQLLEGFSAYREVGADARRPPLPAVSGGQRVTVDRERFQDLLTTLLENLVGTGTTDLRLGVESGMESDHPTVVIAILARNRSPVARAPGPAPRPYLQWLAELAGVRVTSAAAPAAGLHGSRIQCRPVAAA